LNVWWSIHFRYLIATDQVSTGDLIELDFDTERQALTFEKIGQSIAFREMTNLVESGAPSQSAAAQAA
jgi:hypothetical protein